MSNQVKTSEEKLLGYLECVINGAFDKCPFEDFLTNDEIQELKNTERRFLEKTISRIPKKDNVRLIISSEWLNDTIHLIKTHAKNAYNILKEQNNG